MSQHLQASRKYHFQFEDLGVAFLPKPEFRQAAADVDGSVMAPMATTLEVSPGCIGTAKGSRAHASTGNPTLHARRLPARLLGL